MIRMTGMVVTKEFKFDAAHRLAGYEGKCKNIHGHTWKLKLSVEILDPRKVLTQKNYMVVDFVKLSNLVNPLIEEVDHSLLLGTGYSDKHLMEVLRRFNFKIVLIPPSPTSEGMINWFVGKLREPLLKLNLKLVELSIFESATSSATWRE